MLYARCQAPQERRVDAPLLRYARHAYDGESVILLRRASGVR